MVFPRKILRGLSNDFSKTPAARRRKRDNVVHASWSYGILLCPWFTGSHVFSSMNADRPTDRLRRTRYQQRIVAVFLTTIVWPSTHRSAHRYNYYCYRWRWAFFPPCFVYWIHAVLVELQFRRRCARKLPNGSRSRLCPVDAASVSRVSPNPTKRRTVKEGTLRSARTAVVVVVGSRLAKAYYYWWRPMLVL